MHQKSLKFDIIQDFRCYELSEWEYIGGIVIHQESPLPLRGLSWADCSKFTISSTSQDARELGVGTGICEKRSL